MNAIALSPHSVDDVLNRFYRCSDGVIRHVDIVFRSAPAGSEATITISVRDGSAEAQWVNLIWRVEGLEELAFLEGRTSYRVLSDGVVVGWFEGLTFLDFGPYTSAPEGVEDFRRSGFYFAGKAVSWEVVPYAE